MSNIGMPPLPEPSVSRRTKPEQERNVRVVHAVAVASWPLGWREVRYLEHRVDTEPEGSEGVDVIGDRSVVRPGRPGAGHGIERHGHGHEVAVDPAVRKLATLVIAPARVPRLAEGGVGHDDDDPSRWPEGPVERCRDQVEVRDVRDAQEKDRSVEACRPKRGDEVKPPGIADQEASHPRSPLPGSLDESRAYVDAGVLSTWPEDQRGKDALARADIEDVIAGSWREEIERRRDCEALVVGTPALADPAVVPARDVIPAGISPRRSPSGTTLVPGHGRRTDT